MNFEEIINEQRQIIEKLEQNQKNFGDEKEEYERKAFILKEEMRVLTKALDLKAKDLNVQVIKEIGMEQKKQPALVTQKVLVQTIVNSEKLTNLKNALTQLLIQNKKIQKDLAEKRIKVEELEIVKQKYNADLVNLEKEIYALQKKVNKLEAEKTELAEDKQNLLDYIKKYQPLNQPK